jgi:Tfp pilus assembly protein PilO
MKEPEKTRKDKIIKTFKLYVLPIIAIAIFVGIIIFMVFPKVSEIFTDLDKISQNNEVITNKLQEIQSLKALSDNYNGLNSQLEIVNQIAPTGKTEVVKFRDKVTSLMQDNKLSVISQRLSESDVDVKNTNDKKVVGNIILQEVPFIFEVQGKYTNIIAFINNLSTIDDFVIVKEMNLASSNVTGDLFKDDWVFKINLVKYQFSNSNIDLLEKAYLGVSPNSEISKVIRDYIASRKSSDSSSEPSTEESTP